VATLVATRSLGAGAKEEMLAKVERMFGPSSLLVRAGGGGETGPVTTLEMADLEDLEERLPAIVAWDPMQVLGARDVKYRETGLRVAVYGHSERAEVVWGRGVVEGRFFTAEDFARASRVALVGTRTAAALFGDGSPVGEQILIGSAPFRVVGVLEPIGIDPHGMDRDEDVFVPTTTAMRRLLNVDSLAMAKLIVRDPATVEETADQVAEILRQRHGIAPGERDDFMVFTPVFVERMIQRANRVLDVFLPAAAGVVLLVAALVISSILLIAVKERIAEVGLRKAVGATAGQISLQFFTEALGVTLVAGTLGMALGAAVVVVVARKMQLTPVIAPDALALGFAAAVTVGVLSAVWPARQAARLDAVEALRR
jgi:putative ABC transport system permease protein